MKKIDLLPASVNELIFHQRFNQTVTNLIALQYYILKHCSVDSFKFCNFKFQNAKLITLENGKYIHILWQVPQTLLITVAEVMIIVTLLEFTFTQVK